jgi:hypothetical protein
MRLQIAMVKGDFGDWGDALSIIEGIAGWGDLQSGSTSIKQQAKAICEYICCVLCDGYGPY